MGRRFPRVSGRTLSRKAACFPDDLSGAPAVLLVAYRRSAQADVDRWAQALTQGAPGLRTYEVPTIPALAYRPLAGWIDGAMRGGVPQRQWSSVVTVYGDGAVVRDFLGEAARPVAHVVLLDGDGVVRWFDADGYSTAAAAGLLATVAGLSAGTAVPDAPPG
jgi:hypothetical protein